MVAGLRTVLWKEDLQGKILYSSPSEGLVRTPSRMSEARLLSLEGSGDHICPKSSKLQLIGQKSRWQHQRDSDLPLVCILKDWCFGNIDHTGPAIFTMPLSEIIQLLGF